MKVECPACGEEVDANDIDKSEADDVTVARRHTAFDATISSLVELSPRRLSMPCGCEVVSVR